MARMTRKFWAAKTIGQAVPKKRRKLLERLGRLGQSIVRRVRRD